MKKIGSLLLAVSLLLSLGMGQSFAASETTSEVPVVLWNAYEEKLSMGNNCMVKAEIEEQAGATIYTVYTKKMEFIGLTGGLTNLFIYENGKGSAKTEATQIADGVFQFSKPGAPMGEVWVAVWVDAMDELAGGGPGSGEQDARLRFDLAKAKEIGGQEATPEPAPSQEIKILVNGKAITMDVAPFIENDRTMVPVRFISEALGLKVNWVQESKTVEVGEKENKISLAIGQNKITKADGSQVAIDTPARIKEDRTFIPLRAIAEISGAKVGWDGATRTVTVDQ